MNEAWVRKQRIECAYLVIRNQGIFLWSGEILRYVLICGEALLLPLASLLHWLNKYYRSPKYMYKYKYKCNQCTPLKWNHTNHTLLGVTCSTSLQIQLHISTLKYSCKWTHLRVINILSNSYNKISSKIIAITSPTAPKRYPLLRKSFHFWHVHVCHHFCSMTQMQTYLAFSNCQEMLYRRDA